MSVDSDDGRMHLLFRMSCFFFPDKSRVVSRVVHPTFCDFVSVARVCRVARVCFCVVVSLPGLQEDSCLFSLTFRRVLHVFTYFIGSSTLTRFYKRLFVKRNSRS